MIKLYTGCMFAGKTTAMINEAKAYQQVGKRVAIFKPALDIRYGEDVVKTHDNIEMSAYAVQDIEEVMKISTDFDVICFDEVQFFNIELIKKLKQLKFAHKDIIIAGLDTDFRREAFIVSKKVMELADEVIYLKSSCFYCNEEAGYSLRTSASTDLFELGAADKYLPVCLSCHQKHYTNK